MHYLFFNFLDNQNYYMDVVEIFDILKFSNLLSIKTESNEKKIIITSNNETFCLEELFSNKNCDINNLSFIISVLNFYGTLCATKKKSICSYFIEMFPCNILIHYFKKEEIHFEIRAICLKLINSLYLEKNHNPENEITKLMYEYEDSSKIKKISPGKSFLNMIRNFSPTSK